MMKHFYLRENVVREVTSIRAFIYHCLRVPIRLFEFDILNARSPRVSVI